MQGPGPASASQTSQAAIRVLDSESRSPAELGLERHESQGSGPGGAQVLAYSVPTGTMPAPSECTSPAKAHGRAQDLP